MTTASNARALHHAIPSVLEGRCSVDDEDGMLIEAVVDDVFFMLSCSFNFNKAINTFSL